jgi:hypothetical protein
MNPIRQVRANADKFAKGRAKMAMPTGGTQVTAENALQQRKDQQMRQQRQPKAAIGPQALRDLLKGLHQRR